MKAVGCMMSDTGLFPNKGRDFLDVHTTEIVCVSTDRRVTRPLPGRLTDTALQFTGFFPRKTWSKCGNESPNDGLLAYVGVWLPTIRKWPLPSLSA